MMKIILTEDVPNLGVVGDMVSVRDGYGRNYLIPQGKAVFASVRSVAELDHQKRLASHRREQATAEAQTAKTKIEGLSVVMRAKVAPPQLGDDGEFVQDKLQKLFGTITNRDIARFLSQAGMKVDHRRVVLSETVRTVGKFYASVRLDGGIEAKLPFWVVPEAADNVDKEKKRVEEAQEAAKKEEENAELRASEAAVEASRKLAENEPERDEDEDEDE